ncbi:MAG: hypothetical protein AAF637_09290 [Pseudomonadota bacterium]
MWSCSSETLSDGRVRRVALERDGASLSYESVVDLWRASESFRNFFIGVLAEPPYAAYFWETAPLTTTSASRPFEYIVADSPALASMPAEPEAFAAHFVPGEPVASFPNLGGDAWLVAPAPRGPVENHAHIAAFCRNASAEHQHALWQAVGHGVAERLSDAPLWLSTSGLGIAWLHVRLDELPKYYTYAPYRRAPD